MALTKLLVKRVTSRNRARPKPGTSPSIKLLRLGHEAAGPGSNVACCEMGRND